MLNLLAQADYPDYYGTAEVGTATTAGLFGVIMAAMVAQFLIWLVVYAYMALCLQFIAKKTNTPNGWMAWIPIANIILMLQIAKLPLWYIVLFLIPIANIVVAFIVWIKILEVMGKPTWWVILIMLVPVVNFIILGILAFSKDGASTVTPNTTPPAATPPTGTPPAAPEQK